MARKRLLTKSKYLVGLQCPKYLWVMLNEPDRIPKPDTSTQHRFDEGHLVGEWAKNSAKNKQKNVRYFINKNFEDYFYE